MTLRKYLSNKKTKLRINKYRKQVVHIGNNCYLDSNIHFGNCKNSVTIGNNVTLGNSCSFSVLDGKKKPKVFVGDYTWIGNNLNLSCCEENIIIGNHVSIACDVVILGENHDVNNVDGFFNNFVSKPVSIGDGCWIGTRVIVMPGVCLGNHCIVGGGFSSYKILSRLFNDRGKPC